jgi:hypothetical protein
MAKKLALIASTAVVVFYVLIQHLLGSKTADSFLFAYLLLILNTLMLSLTWILNLNRYHKLISVLVTFLKYPIILLSIIWASKQKWMDPMGIVIGVCAFIIIIVTTVLIRKRS